MPTWVWIALGSWLVVVFFILLWNYCAHQDPAPLPPVVHKWHGSSSPGQGMGLCGAAGPTNQVHNIFDDIFDERVTCPHCLSMLERLTGRRYQ